MINYKIPVSGAGKWANISSDTRCMCMSMSLFCSVKEFSYEQFIFSNKTVTDYYITIAIITTD